MSVTCRCHVYCVLVTMSFVPYLSSCSSFQASKNAVPVQDNVYVLQNIVSSSTDQVDSRVTSVDRKVVAKEYILRRKLSIALPVRPLFHLAVCQFVVINYSGTCMYILRLLEMRTGQQSCSRTLASHKDWQSVLLKRAQQEQH